MPKQTTNILGFLTANLGWQAWSVPLILAAVMVATSFYKFTLFHLIAELFPITIAVVLTVVVWNTYRFTRNHFLMYLGCGYFWIAVLDLTHALAYKGMGFLPIDTADPSVQLWIATRYFEALLLISAPIFLTHTLIRTRIFVLFSIITVLICTSIYSGQFPTTFIEGQGLTRFKVGSEYIIILILFGAIFHLSQKRTLLDFKIYNLMVLTLIMTIISELAFTFYISVYGLSNMIGHIFKLFSFWLVFQAIIQTTLREPFTVMARGASSYDSIPEPAIVVDNQGIIHQINHAASEMTHLPEAELLNQHVHSLFHPNPEQSSNDCLICQNIKQGKPLHHIDLECKEQQKWYRYTLSPIETKRGVEGMVQVSSDITAQKHAEQKLVQNEQLLRTLFNTIPDLIWLKDQNGVFLTCNANIEQLLGHSSNEIVGKTDYDFFDKELADFFREHDKMAMEANQATVNEEWLTYATDGHKALVETIKTPMLDMEGQVIGILGVARDITERQQNADEQERLYRELEQTHKMDALGKLTGGIAHDFNNIIGIIIGFSDLAHAHVNNPDKIDTYLTKINNAAKTARDLIAQMMRFSRKEESQDQALQLELLLQEIMGMLQGILPSSITIESKIEQQLPAVMMDASQFQQLVMNLCTNARDGMQEKGHLTIALRQVEINTEECSACHKVISGDYVELSVSDTGSGIDAEVIQRMFEPFYTTKAVGKGTGMGMSVVHSITHNHAGHIFVKTEIGKGTTFRLLFPAILNTETDKTTPVQADETPHGHGEHLLVVDDEADITEYLSDLLDLYGYKTTVTNSSQEALDIFKKNPDQFSLIISDQTMPQLTGVELIIRIRAIKPAFPAILCTGYSAVIDEAGAKKLDIDYLKKPIDKKALIETIYHQLVSHADASPRKG